MKSRTSKIISRYSRHGFTIVETLIAIAVLMIAISGPLVIASKGLFGALASRDQMIATYLAQESMETVKNIRDNNVSLGLTWTNGFGTCVSGNVCDASSQDSSQIIPCISTRLPSGQYTCPIYLESSSGLYGHTQPGAPTLFTRYFYLSTPAGNNGNTNDYVLTVVVDWNEGKTPYEISVSSELTNSTR